MSQKHTAKTLGVQRIFQISILMLISLASCTNERSKANKNENPAASGFDMAHSDPAAVELADSIMAAMGGREAWDKTRFISFKFFDVRNYTWDKKRNRLRVELKKDSAVFLIDLTTLEGRIRLKQREITDVDSLNKLLLSAKTMWVNDSYWLLMPFKLKDAGVTLQYFGEDIIDNGVRCNVLQVTFRNNDSTSGSKYIVYVDLKDNLVKQWAYFKKADQELPTNKWPFDNYRKYGSILLSADRSDGKGPKDVQVFSDLPEKVFTDF